jgi:6-phosphogluconolactonase
MIRQLARWLVPGLLMVAGLCAPAGAQEGRSWVFVGTYTAGLSQGIYVLSFNPETGRLGPAELAAETPSPSFLATDPDRRFLFAVNEVGEFEGRPTGSVASFGLDARTGRLTPLNRRPSGGAGPCHLAVDRTGRTVLVANYGGGSVAALPIAPDGMLGSPLSTIQHEGKSIDPARQEGPHAHFITLDAANRHAIVADLGLDKLLIDTFDAENGVLAPFGELKVEGGSGPRHFAFGRDGRHAYVINEMASTIDALDYDPETARFTRVQTVGTLPEGFRGASSTAELAVHPSGRFLYGSNRGDDSLAIFAIDPETGRLRPVGRTKTGGKTPRNFAIDPTGRWLIAANQDSNTLVVFRIDPETGGLTQVGEPAAVPVPVCVEFVPVAE